MEKRYKMLIKGNVQVIGSRALVKKIANNMDLKGFIRNIPGGVEIIVRGMKRQ